MLRFSLEKDESSLQITLHDRPQNVKETSQIQKAEEPCSIVDRPPSHGPQRDEETVAQDKYLVT